MDPHSQGALACCTMVAGTWCRLSAELAPGDKLRPTIGCDPPGLERRRMPRASCSRACASARGALRTQRKRVLLKVGGCLREWDTLVFRFVGIVGGAFWVLSPFGRAYGFLSQGRVGRQQASSGQSPDLAWIDPIGILPPPSLAA